MRISQVLFTAVLICVLLSEHSNTRAYVLDDGFGNTDHCTGNSQWKVGSGYRNEMVYRMCYEPQWTSGPSWGSVFWSTHDLYQQWHLDGQSKMRLHLSVSHCSPGGATNTGEWHDNGNEINEIWWSVPPNLVDELPYHGITTRDRQACFWFFGDNEYHAADIDINMSEYVVKARPYNVDDCLSTGTMLSDVTLHEIGHSLGLDHNDAWMTVMNQTGVNRNCDLGAGSVPRPFGDDSQGMMAMYGADNWQSRVDVGGTHTFQDGQQYYQTDGETMHCRSDGLVTTSGPNQTWGWTYTNLYGSAGGLRFRTMLVPVNYNGTNPSRNSAGPWGQYASASTFPGATYPVRVPASFNVGAVPAGRYRVWVEVSPVNQSQEIHSSDNLIPTTYVVVVLGC